MLVPAGQIEVADRCRFHVLYLVSLGMITSMSGKSHIISSRTGPAGGGGG